MRRGFGGGLFLSGAGRGMGGRQRRWGRGGFGWFSFLSSAGRGMGGTKPTPEGDNVPLKRSHGSRGTKLAPTAVEPASSPAALAARRRHHHPRRPTPPARGSPR